MKYDKIVEISIEKSKQNALIVTKEIKKMLENKERISIAKLEKRTGFSNSFFYRNQAVHEAIENARRIQDSAYNPNIVIMDKSMEEKLLSMRIELLKLRAENERLSVQNHDLQEQVRILIEENRQLKTYKE